MNKAIFLDRDGTLNEDTMYPYRANQLKILPGVIDGLKQMSAPYLFFIVTNQPGIGRGIFNEDDFNIFNNHLFSVFGKSGIKITHTYHCPHKPEDRCDCRKPSIKYIKQAEQEYQLNLSRSWTIGDHPCDIEMGLNAGTKSIYLLTGHGKKHRPELKERGIQADYIARNFLDAAEFIMKNPY